tara:strand:+ start:919 stop:1104 length:186 start_codon:yes stop_codon:yes gene_type:complete
MSCVEVMKSESDGEAGRLVELLRYKGDDGLMPKYMVKLNGVLVYHSDAYAYADFEYSMECA